MKKPYQLSATEAAKKIQANQLSSEELLRSCIERIEEKESSTQAWVATNFRAAIDRARYLDRSSNQGLLHGLPLARKTYLIPMTFQHVTAPPFTRTIAPTVMPCTFH